MSEGTAPCIEESGEWGDEWSGYWSNGVARCTPLVVQMSPPGIWWTREPCTWLYRMWNIWGQQICKLKDIQEDMDAEMLPTTCVQTLPEWEDWLGLPEECFQPVTFLARRAAVVAKWLTLIYPNAGKELFDGVANQLGFTLQSFYQYGNGFAAESKAEDKVGPLYLGYQLAFVFTGNGDKATLECLFKHYLPLWVLDPVFIYE